MKISIITASYNYDKYIEETINSVINQSYKDWELIVADDGSSDNSVEIIKSFCEKDSRIKLFQHQDGQNKGLKETLLLGLKHTTGDWIAFLESDDYMSPENLTKKAQIIEKYPEVKLVFNKVSFLCEGKATTKRLKRFTNIQNTLPKMEFPKNMFKEFFTDNKVLTFSCVMVEANTLKAANFNTPLDTFLDWWLWIHLAYKNDFYYIDQELTQWRLHDESYIKKTKMFDFLFPIKAYEDVYSKDKSLNLWLFIQYSKVKLLILRFLRYIYP